MADSDKEMTAETADKEIAEEESAKDVEQPITFKDFLERTHPSITKLIHDFWSEIVNRNGNSLRLGTFSDIRLHCRRCEGERTFRALAGTHEYMWGTNTIDVHPVYRCGDCLQELKRYALHITFVKNKGCNIYKYGEIPAFGIPVPNRLLRLFGKEDSNLFMKGRQCESLGYGIAAFAYYRRVVENHRNDLFDEIIKVCHTVGASAELIEELNTAKTEISFSKSMGKIKSGLPEGLLIGGHNPLNALHGALSVGLHNETDEDCLDYAQAVRLVLGDLVDRIAQLKQENKNLANAVQRLLAKKA